VPQATSSNVGETVQARRISRGVSSMSTRALSAQVARSSQQVTTKVLASSRAVCRISGRQVLAIRSGQCRVMVTVRTTNGRTISRVLTFLAQR
jgi:response regulator of citrate/malate metabolism